MKTPLSFLLIFLCVLLWMPPVLSKTYPDTKSNSTFSFDGSTTSTSRKLAGYGSESWHVTGYASITGTASELGQDSVYKCELWLMATGDLDSSPFPGKGNSAAEAGSDGTGAKEKIVTKGDAKILYRSHPVGSIAEDEANWNGQTQRSLSRTLSASHANSASSPTDLCASPEFHGDLSGTLMNFSGSKSVLPLSFKSKANKACADSPDDGKEVIAGEKCKRGSLCLKPGTATLLYSHRVECPEERWIWEGIKVGSHKFFSKKQDCEGVWWTCDDDPDVCSLTASHVPASEKSWKQKYVAPDGSVSQYPPTDNTPNCSSCTSHCSSPCRCSNSGTCNGTVLYHPCSVHETSVSGDHSLQASCSSTDSNGNYCTVTNFYACDSHTHSYPAPPPTPPPPPPPEPEPPPPPSPTLCPANAWTGCGSTTSHAKTCGGGHTYYTCNPSAVAYHAPSRTCRRSGCGNTWAQCQMAPSCNTWTGNKCWAR